MKARISHKSLVSELSLPPQIWRLIISEYLLVLPERLGGPRVESFWGLTIEQLANQVELPVQKVIQFLQRTIRTIADGIEVQELPVVAERGSEQRFVLWDMRSSEDEHQQSVAGSIIVDHFELSDLLKDAAGKDKVVCFCNDGHRSLSAALSLREEFSLPAYALAGGLRTLRESI